MRVRGAGLVVCGPGRCGCSVVGGGAPGAPGHPFTTQPGGAELGNKRAAARPGGAPPGARGLGPVSARGPGWRPARAPVVPGCWLESGVLPSIALAGPGG
eukprot:6347501-Alexandrium_andersonii.AAC.1